MKRTCGNQRCRVMGIIVRSFVSWCWVCREELDPA